LYASAQGEDGNAIQLIVGYIRLKMPPIWARSATSTLTGVREHYIRGANGTWSACSPLAFAWTCVNRPRTQLGETPESDPPRAPL